MPGGDGTGPTGFGPMSGRAAGYCAGFAGPGYMNAGRGGFWGRGGGFRGRGRGFGRGFGYGYGVFPTYAPTQTPEQELDGLKQQAEMLQDGLNQINNRIEQLQKVIVKAIHTITIVRGGNCPPPRTIQLERPSL